MTLPEAEPADQGPVGWRRATTAAANAGLGRPDLWPLALVSFLLRGGFFLYLLPIVVVPSTVGLATWIGPTAITAAGPSERFVGIAAGAIALFIAWFVGGGLVAAVAEIALIRRSLGDGAAPSGGERSGGVVPSRDGRAVGVGLAVRLLIVRFVAATPLIVAFAWGIPRIVGAGYRELTLPSDTATPFPLRVLRDVPEVLLVVLAAWLFAETVGGLAARRIVLFGDGGPASTVRAILHLARRPLATLGTLVVTLSGLLLLVVPGLVASALTWDRLGRTLVGDPEILLVSALTVLFVAIWASGLALAGAAAAWRNVAWTLEVLRADDEVRWSGALRASLRQLLGPSRGQPARDRPG